MKNDYQFVDGTRLSSVIEALIFASEEPISGQKIKSIIVENEEQIEISEETVSNFVDKLNTRYDENGLSFRIERIAKGYTFVTQKKFHYWLSVFQHENAYRKLSQSAIESLAIVAYKQPITKPEVDQIRGVDSGYILRQLMEKALIEVSGRSDSPGKPLLYTTTSHFLRHFGINSVEELPKPREIEEILKDDDMAEHRQLLLEQSMIMEEEEDGTIEIKEDEVAKESDNESEADDKEDSQTKKNDEEE
ncbi:MAG: SMC-Scp complex subunit ScpB [Balneola sp.]